MIWKFLAANQPLRFLECLFRSALDFLPLGSVWHDCFCSARLALLLRTTSVLYMDDTTAKVQLVFLVSFHLALPIQVDVCPEGPAKG